MGKKRRKQRQQMVKAQPEVFAPETARVAKKLKRSEVREFKAGEKNRFNADIPLTMTSLDQSLYMYLANMRSASRYVYNNTEYGRRFISRLKNKCIGPRGIGIQVQALRTNGTIDKADSRMVETSYKNWSKRGNYDVTATMSRAEGEMLILHHIAQDGEVVIRIRKGYDNPFGYAYQFIDPERLDEKLNRIEANGNRTVMGVEKNEFDRPVAYHILTHHPMPWNVNPQTEPRRHERVPANEIIHRFAKIRSEQTRGVPWTHAAMRALQDLGGYREAAVLAARVGASKAFWIRRPDVDGFTGEDEDGDGNALMSAEPGTAGELNADEDLIEWTPNYPHEQFDAFNNALLKGMSAALDTTHHALSGDLSGVNYSSARAGDRDEFDVLTVTQQIIIDINDDYFPDWLQYQLDTGRMAAPPRLFDKLNAAIWQPKRWQEIDPNRTATANDLNLKNGLDSEIRIITEQQGRDPEAVILERKRWIEMHEEAGIPLVGNTIAEEETQNET